MKKFKIILVFLITLLAISGCGKKDDAIVTTPESGNDTPTLKNEQQAEVKPEKISAEIADLTEVTSYVGDVDGDGSDETVVLSTSAERNAKGEFLWNDGQDWALYVKDMADSYVLFDGFVQAGSVYFEISDYYMKDGAQPRISVIVSTSAGFSIKNYAFKKEKSAYIEDVLFDTKDVTEGGINRRFSSLPEIEK